MVKQKQQPRNLRSRYEYNKVATGINKKYLDTFGFDNKTNSEETIAQFIKDSIENGIASTQPSTLQSQIQAGGPAYNPRSLSSFSKPELVDLINAKTQIHHLKGIKLNHKCMKHYQFLN